jgi:sugar phosphate permease
MLRDATSRSGAGASRMQVETKRIPVGAPEARREELGSMQMQCELRRRWLALIPAVFVTYSLAYLDRANYGFGAAAGLVESLHITGSESALLGALFFLGYFLFQVPGAAFARRHSTRWLVGLALIAWGLCASLTGIIRSFPMLALDRLLLGVAESFILPAMLVLLTNWFLKGERSRTNTLLLLGNPVTVLWMSAVTGFLMSKIGWQRAFIVEGLPSIVWGLVWLAIIRDRPRDAAWMSAESCTHLETAMEREQLVLPSVNGFWSALRHPLVVLLCLQYFFWSVGVYGFVLWLPVIVRRGASRGMGITGLLTAVPYIFAIVGMLTLSHLSDRTVKRARLVWPSLLLAGVALFGSYVTVDLSFWWAYGCLLLSGAAMYAPYGPFFAIVPEILPRTVAGEVMALVNSFGALGGFFGVWLVGLLEVRTGSSKSGFLLMSMTLMIASFIMLGIVVVQREIGARRMETHAA